MSQQDTAVALSSPTIGACVCDRCRATMLATDAECGKCGKQYDLDAPACVHCGGPIGEDGDAIYRICVGCDIAPGLDRPVHSDAANDGLAPTSLPFVVHCLDDEAGQEPSWVLSRFGIAAGRPTLLTGLGGVGKTVLLRDLALAVASADKRAWGGLAVEADGAVLHVNYEEPDALHRLWWRRMALGRGLELAQLAGRLGWTHGCCALPDQRLYDWLARACDGRVLLTIDSLSAGSPGVDENATAFAAPLHVLTRVSVATGCAIVAAHHDAKAGHSRGTTAIVNACQTSLGVDSAKGSDARTIGFEKSNLGPAGPPHGVRFVDEGEVDAKWKVSARLRVEACAPARGKSSGEDGTLEQVNRMADANRRGKLRANILSALDAGELPLSRLVEKAGGRAATATREVAAMVAESLLVERPGERNARVICLPQEGPF